MRRYRWTREEEFAQRMGKDQPLRIAETSIPEGFPDNAAVAIQQ
jgi:hypothetical protein